ncbi:MAG: glycosyltransferase family 39 protein, partial [Chloroflexota bacterium]
MIKKTIPLILILLLAFGLRMHRLTEVPPGLTHDEANHGRDSINILDGVLLFYFPLNYGSEPLYNYVVAGNMALLGENLFALRYVNVIFGLLALSATYLWAARAFGRRTG